MTSIAKLAGATLLALSAIAPAEISYGMSQTLPQPAVAQQTDVTNVAWRRVCNRRGCRRVWVGRRIIVRPRVVVVRPRVVVRPARGGRHVTWCLNRYRSYDPATNTFVGYDGRLHVCISPFR